MKKINDVELSEVLNKGIPTNGKPIILDFFAEWCGPCKVLGPILEEIDSENEDFDIYKLDADEASESCKEYGIRNLPTMIMIKTDGTQERLVGMQPKANLVEKFKALV